VTTPSISFTTEEMHAKTFISEVFTPTLHNVLQTANPGLYEIWSGNACRQAAVFGTLFLKELLPNYRWTAWDGFFHDKVVIEGQLRDVAYNHAWIYGIDFKAKRSILVDPSRQKQERLFLLTEKNEYPKDHVDYQYLIKRSSKKIDLKARMKEDEFYTGLSSKELLVLLQERCQTLSLDEEVK
jgi:hypothetical protein